MYIEEILYEMRKWNEMKNDRRRFQRNLSNYVKKPEKNSGPQRGLNQRSYDTGAMLKPDLSRSYLLTTVIKLLYSLL